VRAARKGRSGAADLIGGLSFGPHDLSIFNGQSMPGVPWYRADRKGALPPPNC